MNWKKVLKYSLVGAPIGLITGYGIGVVVAKLYLAGYL